ncbi:MAG: hypothetical protein MUF54_18835 [Polyangiaceae bacterium]|nr:hypothetical protein [Polyangiaceae bacterium]
MGQQFLALQARAHLNYLHRKGLVGRARGVNVSRAEYGSQPAASHKLEKNVAIEKRIREPGPAVRFGTVAAVGAHKRVVIFEDAPAGGTQRMRLD